MWVSGWWSEWVLAMTWLLEWVLAQVLAMTWLLEWVLEWPRAQSLGWQLEMGFEVV